MSLGEASQDFDELYFARLPSEGLRCRTARSGSATCIDDYCPRCRLLLNHDVASLVGGAVAKVTCRTCYNTHDYRHAQVPPEAHVARRRRQEEAHGPGARLHARRRRRAASGRPQAEPPVRPAQEARPVGRGRAASGRIGAGVRAVDVIQRKRDGARAEPRGDRLLRRAATPRARSPTTRPRPSRWPSSSGA